MIMENPRWGVLVTLLSPVLLSLSLSHSFFFWDNSALEESGDFFPLWKVM